MKIRVIHEQQQRLLTVSERQFLNNKQAFKPFAGLNPVLYSPFTVPLWNAALAQYGKSVEPVEERVAAKLREKFANSKAKSHQVSNTIFEFMVSIYF